MPRLQRAWALLLALALLVPSATFAASVEFGQPSADGAFGEVVTFRIAFAADEPPTRVELLSRQPGDSYDRVSEAVVERDGDQWVASAFVGGHIVPNTSWRYRFRAQTDEGPVEGPEGEYRLADDRFAWRSLTGEHVTVRWYEGDEDFARRALEIAEEALASAAGLLGVEEVEPLDFLVYADTGAFREAMGPATRENVGGQAHPGIRTLFGLIEPRQIGSDWVTELVTHELTHLVFHEAADNAYQYPPRWLNEGLAVYLSKGYQADDRAEVAGAAGGGTIIPLEGLGGQFPTRSARQGLAYAESVSAVDYLVETYGEAALVELIGGFAEGLGTDGAFEASVGLDLAAFDAAWLSSLGAGPPVPYGPPAASAEP